MLLGEDKEKLKQSLSILEENSKSYLSRGKRNNPEQYAARVRAEQQEFGISRKEAEERIKNRVELVIPPNRSMQTQKREKVPVSEPKLRPTTSTPRKDDPRLKPEVQRRSEIQVEPSERVISPRKDTRVKRRTFRERIAAFRQKRAEKKARIKGKYRLVRNVAIATSIATAVPLVAADINVLSSNREGSANHLVVATNRSVTGPDSMTKATVIFDAGQDTKPTIVFSRGDELPAQQGNITRTTQLPIAEQPAPSPQHTAVAVEPGPLPQPAPMAPDKLISAPSVPETIAPEPTAVSAGPVTEPAVAAQTADPAPTDQVVPTEPVAAPEVAAAPEFSTEAGKLANEILNNPNISIDSSQNDRVRRSIQVITENGKTFLHDVDNPVDTSVDPGLLRIVLDLARNGKDDNVGLKLIIESLSTSYEHAANSTHYTGHGIDLGFTSKEDFQAAFAFLYENRGVLGINELIYGGQLPEGTNTLSNGTLARYSPSTLIEHTTHIHVST
jgi:hypothetical protein